jgi:hypothetical protein
MENYENPVIIIVSLMVQYCFGWLHGERVVQPPIPKIAKNFPKG